jgi:hypothetical protein
MRAAPSLLDRSSLVAQSVTNVFSPLIRADRHRSTIRFTHLTSPPLQRRSGYPEGAGRLVDRQTSDALNTCNRYDRRGGRLSRVPCAFARCKPAHTLSRIRSRSNSAIAPRLCICNLPAGVVASIPSPSRGSSQTNSGTPRKHGRLERGTCSAPRRRRTRSTLGGLCISSRASRNVASVGAASR